MAEDMRISRLFQLCGDALEGKIDGLNDTVSRLQRQVGDLQTRLQGYEDLQSQMLRVLRNPAKHPNQRHFELERLLANHERQIVTLSQRMTELRKELVSDDYLVHGTISADFNSFVNQDLINIAASQDTGDEQRIAAAVASLSRGLFTVEPRGWPDDRLGNWLAQQGVQVAPKELARLRQKANGIMQAALDSRHEHEWDFTQSTTLDTRRHKLWPGCRDQAEINFVVAPAYVVEKEKVYQLQYVFTAVQTPKHRQSSNEANALASGAALEAVAAPLQPEPVEGDAEPPPVEDASMPAAAETTHGDQG